MLAKKPKGATPKRASSGAAGLIWMFVGALLTLMIGFFLYLWNPLNMGVEPTPQERPTVQPMNKASTEGGDYQFYDLLPEQEITSIPDAPITDADADANNPNGEAPAAFEPDVVVVIPRPQAQPRGDNTASEGDNSKSSQSQNGANSTSSNNAATATSKSDTAANPATSTDTIANPMQSADSPRTGNNDTNKVVVVEEEGTYDDPSSPTTSNRNDKVNAPDVQKAATTGTAVKNASASITASDVKKTYILQINSYSGSEEADKRRAQVLMAGVDARVVKRKMDNGQTFYQVVSTQMSNAQRVKMVQQKLQNSGIDSLIVEQQHS